MHPIGITNKQTTLIKSIILLGLLRIAHLQKTMAHAQTNGSRTVGVRSQRFLVEGERSAKVLLVERNASLAE